MIPGLGRSPGGGHSNPLQYFKPHGQGSLAGYSPWGHKESYTTEQLNTVTIHLTCNIWYWLRCKVIVNGHSFIEITLLRVITKMIIETNNRNLTCIWKTLEKKNENFLLLTNKAMPEPSPCPCGCWVALGAAVALWSRNWNCRPPLFILCMWEAIVFRSYCPGASVLHVHGAVYLCNPAWPLS